MNKQIREFAEQANEWASKQCPYKSYSQLFTEKFAELIIRDVVKTVKRTQNTSADFEWAILNNYDWEVEQ